jgi:hypothetical protein
MYSHLRYAVRNNDINVVNNIWISSWPLFISTNKSNYARLTFYFQYTIKYAHPTIVELLNKRLVSMYGLSNHFIAPDMVTEKQNLKGRYKILFVFIVIYVG